MIERFEIIHFRIICNSHWILFSHPYNWKVQERHLWAIQIISTLAVGYSDQQEDFICQHLLKFNTPRESWTRRVLLNRVESSPHCVLVIIGCRCWISSEDDFLRIERGWVRALNICDREHLRLYWPGELSLPSTQRGQVIFLHWLPGRHSTLTLSWLKSPRNLFHLLPAWHWKLTLSPCEGGLVESQAELRFRLEAGGGEGCRVHFDPAVEERIE